MKDIYSLDELREIVKKVSLDEILNKKGIVYKERRAELEGLSTEDLLAEMAKEPKLIRRPLVILDDRVIVGFDPAAYEKISK